MPKSTPIESDDVRLMPYSAESERAILGAILLDEKAFLIASELLQADDFYLEAHRIIFQRMLDLRRDERGIDAFTLLAEIRRHDEVEKIGGVGYLANLTDGLPRGMNAEHYARNVREKATLRECIQECHAATAAAYQGEHAASEILDSLQSKLIRLSVRESKGGFRPMADICADGYRELELQAELGTGVHGLSTGFADFDSYTCGLQRGDLIIIAARPSQGKTALCLNIAVHAAI
ncbi:MAG: DnaB-like helicase N-terminal domain-containing protein, partial [bacterium]